MGVGGVSRFGLCEGKARRGVAETRVEEIISIFVVTVTFIEFMLTNLTDIYGKPIDISIDTMDDMAFAPDFTEALPVFTAACSDYAEACSDYAEESIDYADVSANYAEVSADYAEVSADYAEESIDFAEPNTGYAEVRSDYGDMSLIAEEHNMCCEATVPYNRGKSVKGRSDKGKLVFRHHNKRRKHGHDYKGKGIYHITVNKNSDMPVFSTLVGDARIMPGEPGAVSVRNTPLGEVIRKELYKFGRAYPYIKLYQYIIMPDHMHILLNVVMRLDQHLGEYLSNLMGNISRRWSNEQRLNTGEDQICSVFEPGYNDRYLHLGRNLDIVYQYIRHNPHRLAMRRLHPEFFRSMREIEINGMRFQAYGNLFLVRNPWRQQVVVHRADSAETRRENLNRWIDNACNEGVAISPFISNDEKAARRAIEEAGGNIILIQHEAITDRWKPAAHDFDLCCQGRLLILVPIPQIDTYLSRKACLAMNDIAARLATI